MLSYELEELELEEELLLELDEELLLELEELLLVQELDEASLL
jgi:hypothetical protein